MTKALTIENISLSACLQFQKVIRDHRGGERIGRAREMEWRAYILIQRQEAERD